MTVTDAILYAIAIPYADALWAAEWGTAGWGDPLPRSDAIRPPWRAKDLNA